MCLYCGAVCTLHSSYRSVPVLRCSLCGWYFPMWCGAVPCRAVPCRAVPCRAVPCRAVPCRAVPCRPVPSADCCSGGIHRVVPTAGNVVGLRRASLARYGCSPHRPRPRSIGTVTEPTWPGQREREGEEDGDRRPLTPVAEQGPGGGERESDDPNWTKGRDRRDWEGEWSVDESELSAPVAEQSPGGGEGARGKTQTSRDRQSGVETWRDCTHTHTCDTPVPLTARLSEERARGGPEPQIEGEQGPHPGRGSQRLARVRSGAGYCDAYFANA